MLYAYRRRLFKRPIIAKPENIFLYTKVAISLYNFLSMNELSVDCPVEFVDGGNEAGNIIWEGGGRDEEACTNK